MNDPGNSRLASILESVDAAIITINNAGIVQDVNSATAKLFGFQRAEILGNNVRMLMPDPYREEHDGYIGHHVETGEKRIIGIGRKVTGRHKSGSHFPMHLSVAKFEDDGNVYFTGIIHDLSELDRAQSLSSRLGQIVDESVNEVYTFEVASLRFTTANKRALENLGYSLSELCRTTPVDIVKNLTESILRQTLKPLVERDQVRVHFAQKLVRKDNSEYDADVNIHLSDAFDPPELVAIVQDVTENNRMLEALRHTQKMDSIGNLTGGIAHDFNNILTVIMGNLELLADEVKGAENHALVKEAKDASEMGARLTNRLLAFARRSVLAPAQININDLITDVSEMLKRTLGDNIQLHTNLDPALRTTWIDISEFENALVNLAINSRDAMPNGGELVIESTNTELDEDVLSGSMVSPGNYVRVSITDTGSGIANEVKDSLFEPFVSTKSESHGTGLGLSMVYGFIKQSGGHVYVYSEPNEGTTFSLYLPATNEAKEPHTDAHVPLTSRSQDAKVILVVEDDELVRKLSVRRLQRMGHEVIGAEDGHAALTLFKELPTIDLVFTDIVMSEGMSGYDLALAVKAIKPDIRVLLTSGYAEDIVNVEKLVEANLRLLRKPYSQQELVDALDGVFSDV